MRVGGRGRRRRRHRSLCSSNQDDDLLCSLNNNSNGLIRIMKSTSNSSHFKYWTIIASSALFALMAPVTNGSMLPVWGTELSSAGMARNIRHLPCVSRRTGETGLCMFAYSCAKANGTHLGTCIDRFYFGSCCKVPEGSDVDLIQPIVNNHLSNKEDGLISSSTFKSTYQKPTSLPSLPNFSGDSFGSSTVSLPISMSTVSRPLSISMPSSTDEVYSSTTFTKTSGSSSSLSSQTFYEAAASKTPFVNVTFTQLYSTPSPHVTTSPVYTSTMMATIVSGTHKPVPAFATTGYSKPFSNKPTSKPGIKPKPPSLGSNKPGTKPKPKPPIKPTSPGTPSYPAAYSQTATTATSYLNKTTTLHSSFTNNGLSSKPYFVTDSTVPTKFQYPSSTTGYPPPVQQFTPTKKPTKQPSKPTIASTVSSSSSNNYVKIPVSTVSQSRPSTTMSSMSTHTIQSIHEMFSSSTVSSSPEQIFHRINTTFSEETITERPATRPWMSTSDKPYSTRPWPSLVSSSSSVVTTTQPPLVTWTTIDEVPGVILPDRSKPPSSMKPTSSKPYFSKPTFGSTSSGKPSSGKPTKPTFRPEVEVDYRPHLPTLSTPTTTTTTATSPSWVEVSVTTHAPTTPPSVSETTSTMTTVSVSYGSSKPSTTLTIPVASPLPIDPTATPSPLETNEIETSSINMTDYKDVCGRRLFPTARIVGGEKATFGKWPWQISLRQWRTSTYLHKCGAALFNENWAVTAAHCVENVPPSDLLLRLGEHDLSMEEEPYGYQERRVQIVASHPQFDPRTFEYDLALLRFYEPVKFQPNIIPICVPEDDTNFVGSNAFVTGWGRLYEDGPLPSVLQEVSVPVINNTVCESMYQSAGYIEHIPHIFICAGWRKGGFDSCEGDSGGPMVIQRPDKRWLLAGIISWGIGCAEPNQPGVYTRISEFRDWINQILQF